MIKTTFKSSLLVLALAFNFSLSFARENNEANNFIYDTKYENEVMVSKTVFEKDQAQSLLPKTMYEFKYDAAGRIAEKIAYRWDRKQNCWVNNFRMACTYDEAANTVSIAYQKWDAESNSYSGDVKHQSYTTAKALEVLTAQR